MKIALALVLSLLLAAPAAAADTLVRDTGETGIIDLDSYRDRVAWTEGNDDDAMALWTLERGVATPVAVAPVKTPVDVTRGPQGQPVAVYRRCVRERCAFWVYDFTTRRERRLRGAPRDNFGNWSFWGDRFALIRRNHFVVAGLDGSSRTVGRAVSLNNHVIDFNGRALGYIRDRPSPAGRSDSYLAAFPVTGKGTILKFVPHSPTGGRWLNDARLDERYGYALEVGNELRGPNRFWRVELRTGSQQWAPVAAGALRAVHVGGGQVLFHRCREDSEACALILSDVRFRDR